MQVDMYRKSALIELIMRTVVDGFSTRLVHGMLLNPVRMNWSWISNTSANYALHAVRSTSHSTDASVNS